MMRRLVLLTPLAALSVNAQASSEAEVRGLMNAFLAAFQNLDWPAFRKCWADRPVIFHPTAAIHPDHGHIDDPQTFDAEWKGLFETVRKSAAQRGVATPPFMKLEPKDLRIDFPIPDVAVVTFHLRSSTSRIGRRMFVVARSAAGWKITHLHASNLSLSPEAK
ncbi:MAG: nuclear transport factor 2 family protein [Acidobacteria bacterium]|nr:nuclear transport factor 2 family protein [Acidobacteriota bacterium]